MDNEKVEAVKEAERILKETKQNPTRTPFRIPVQTPIRPPDHPVLNQLPLKYQYLNQKNNFFLLRFSSTHHLRKSWIVTTT